MGLFDLFGGNNQPQIELPEYLKECKESREYMEAAKEAFEVDWNYFKTLPEVKTARKGKHCLYFIHTPNEDKLHKLFKNEMIDGYYLLERACECGSSLAAVFLAVLYQHGVGRPVNGPVDIEANLDKALKYYDKAAELGTEGARLAGVFITFMQTATNFNDMAGREEALIMSAAFAAAYRGPLYEIVQEYLTPEDKENIQWLVSLVVCWYASQGYPTCLSFVANMLYCYDNENGYVKSGAFYDRFSTMVSRKQEATNVIDTHLVPKAKAGDQNTLRSLEFFGWTMNC